jgi:flavin-dependent dehydrogenase
MTDVFVIGGGPAGLAAAIAARRKGLSAVVADGNRPPIDKACGEGLMPDSRASAARIGIEIPDEAGFPFRGIRFHGAGRSVQADFQEGHGLGVRRTVLHRLLVDTAERAGVELRWGATVSGLESISARWIIGADGSSSRVRKWAGLDRFARNTRRYACRRHYGLPPWTDLMEIYWGEQCQIYVTPVSKQEVCIALISKDRSLRLDEALDRRFPVLNTRLRGVEVTSRARGATTSMMRLRNVTRGNVALIGDASGSVDAITGEGLCLAFKQAALLAEGMAWGDLSEYARRHPALALKPTMMARAMMMLDIGPRVRTLGMGALSAAPWIFEKLLEVHVG